MDLQLHGKVAIVTGASRGIGRAIARTLADEGMSLTLVARSQDLLRELSQSLSVPTLVQAVDLREPETPQSIVEATLKRFGHLDLLVNNAGATVRGDFLSLSDETWQDGFSLKFYGAMRCCRAAWSSLQARKGSIVNIVGIGGRTGSSEFAIGGAVNAALLNLTKVLADRGIAEGIRVNAINPGAILTDRLQTRIQKLADERHMDSQAAELELARQMKIDRFGTPEEIGRVVAFLASPVAGYCQGMIVDVDGGQTRTL